MKLADALNLGKNQLKNCGIESFAIDALLLLRFITGFSKEKIIFDSGFELDDNLVLEFEKLIERRCDREPISHIIQHREFFGLDFKVSSKVLDPRPDSENLVELILDKIGDKKITTLELGVGSGCLTISILKNNKNCQAFGVDISLDALAICAKNIENHQLDERFKIAQSDMFDGLEGDKKFDIIISNPPYIKSQDIDDLQDEVRIFEPKIALDGGEDGLVFYREIASKAKKFLNKKGLVFLEIGFDQKNDVVAIFEENNFELYEEKTDLAGNDRVLCFLA